MGNLSCRVVVAAAAFAALAIYNHADAAPFRGDRAACENMGGHALNVVQMRDAGVPWKEFEAWLHPQLDSSVKEEGTYIKSQGDVDYVLMWFKRIYDEPQVRAAEFYSRIYLDCMKKPASYSL